VSTTATGTTATDRAVAHRPDHDLVRRVRQAVADRLTSFRRREEAGGRPPLTPADERQFARSLVVQVLEDHARAELAAGREPLTPAGEEAVAAAVGAALFGVGRLQPLLEDPDVENVDVNGCDRVFVSYADGREELHDPVAESDEDLVELVQVLAGTVGLASRPFDAANPQLDLRLPDGSRLSAVMGVCRRPALSIRRARLATATLADLVAAGTMTDDLAQFLRAAVRARKNVMIAGSTNSGKTTLLRALAAEIGPHERLITVERALELGLDLDPLHPNAVAFEERLPNSEGQGAVTMADLVRRSLRMNPSRVIVGEVLGDEIVTMLNAMSQGNDGSLSTIHANSSAEVFNRIATYALQASERLPVEATHLLVAGAVDFVVFLHKQNTHHLGGGMRRVVASVREVTGVDGRVLSSEVFLAGPDGTARAHAPLQCADDLAAAGYVAPAHEGWVA
jgi:Flp pilus assembly CpaF family ATPase